MALKYVETLLMLFHMFRKYPKKRFIIIADYKKEVMRNYLALFADIKYNIVGVSGTGTCSCVKQVIDLTPDSKPFMLIGSALMLPIDFRLPDGYESDTGEPSDDYVGLFQIFSCR